MATINLAPGSRFLVAARTRQQRLFLVAALVAGALLLTWVILFVIRMQLQKTQSTLRNQLTTVGAEIAKLSPDSRRIVLFENRLSALDSLFNSHVNWNPVLSDLEKFLVPTVVVSSIELDGNKGTAVLKGYTTDWDQVAQLVASLSNGEGHQTSFTRVDLSNIDEKSIKAPTGETTKRYEFVVSLMFDTAKLRLHPS